METTAPPTEVPSRSETEASNAKTLCVETKSYGLKECSVNLISLESIVFAEDRNSSRRNKNKNKHPNKSDNITPLTTDAQLLSAKPASTNESATTPLSTVPNQCSDPGQADKKCTTTSSSKERSSKRYGCRMCSARVSTAQELKDHHGSTHGIMYCKHCTKAFNNQLSLTRHEYEHRSRPFVCKTCGEDFPFQSQYNTHRLSHSQVRKHACTYHDCEQ